MQGGGGGGGENVRRAWDGRRNEMKIERVISGKYLIDVLSVCDEGRLTEEGEKIWTTAR